MRFDEWGTDWLIADEHFIEISQFSSFVPWKHMMMHLTILLANWVNSAEIDELKNHVAD